MSDNFACDYCGMPVGGLEYHPFAACLMFRACKDSRTVRKNLAAVMKHGADVKAIVGVARGSVEEQPHA